MLDAVESDAGESPRGEECGCDIGSGGVAGLRPFLAETTSKGGSLLIQIIENKTGDSIL